jgi:CRISPR-associated protein Cmr1
MSLVELELQLETPLFAGGHEPLRLDELWILRPSEIKGVWRWWARALAAGALYDAGQLKGTGKPGILKAPTPAEAGKISEIVGLRMGLGYADPRGRLSKASSYSLIVEPVGDVGRFKRVYRGGPVAALGRQVNLQRANLLALGSRQQRGWQAEYLAPGARFRVRVEEQLPVNAEGAEAALSALALALTLGCFGKGGRRGLGCFRVIRATGRFAALFDVRTSVADKVTRAVNAARMVAEMRAVESEAGELPPLPLVSARDLTGGYAVRGRKLWPFQVIEVRGGDASRLLKELHNFFLRGVRARRLLGNPASPDDLRQKLVAWVLGLPREQQERRERRETGYEILARAVDRRASPLLLAVHGTDREGIAYLSVFASADWPEQLKWRGDTTQLIVVNDAKVAEALVTAVEEFVDYVDRCGFEVRFAWP